MNKIFRRDSVDTSLSAVEQSILEENRRVFVEVYSIISENSSAPYIYDLRSLFASAILDHVRLYKCSWGSVLFVCSNYGAPPPAILGMQRMPYTYHPKATTYFKAFQDTMELRRLVAALKALKNCGHLERINQAIVHNA